jgi:hypothetical protein
VGFLNSDVYQSNRLQTMGDTPPRNVIFCPCVRPSPLYSPVYRWVLFNQDIEGGPHPHPHDPGDPAGQAGPYGKAVVPPPPPWQLYTLGASLLDFPRPSYQIAAWESEASTDYTSYRWGEPAYILLGTEAGHNPWVGGGGQWAFRHVLPADRRQYQTQASGCFVFLDAHAEILRPPDSINLPERFIFRPG